MLTLLIIGLFLAAIAIVFWDKIKRQIEPTASPVGPQLITLYCYNGYALDAQVLPPNTYVPALGRAPKNLSECPAADWYPSKSAAVNAGPPVPVPPPFGGTPPTPGSPRLFSTTVQVNEDGTFVASTWTNIVAV